MTKFPVGTVIRNCGECGKPVEAKAHQSDEARACSPRCARAIAYKEHPDLDSYGGGK
jgi:endogenous inhibitor of DNA gyrase (YacG/DUF329 family)